MSVGVFARDACVPATGGDRREKMLSIGGYDHSIWKCHMFFSAWEFSSPTRGRIAGWTLARKQLSPGQHYGML